MADVRPAGLVVVRDDNGKKRRRERGANSGKDGKKKKRRQNDRAMRAVEVVEGAADVPKEGKLKGFAHFVVPEGDVEKVEAVAGFSPNEKAKNKRLWSYFRRSDDGKSGVCLPCLLNKKSEKIIKVGDSSTTNLIKHLIRAHKDLKIGYVCCSFFFLNSFFLLSGESYPC